MTRAIICEDDPLLALDLELGVRDAGGEVVGVYASAKAAIEGAKALRPHLALVDLNLSDGATGSDVATALSELGCKVVVISGGTRDGTKLFGIDHTFISKPAPAHVISDIIRSYCANADKVVAV